MNEKYRSFAFTSWKFPQLKGKSHLIDYLVWGEEYTPSTGLLHFQGYVEFKKAYTISYTKSIFKDKTLHLEEARASRAQNKAYCLKSCYLLRSFELNNSPEIKEA